MTFRQRDRAYIRKSDGRRVVVADWPDGDVSWRLEPLPLVLCNGSAVGTCSREAFEASHVPEAD
jgi:hypothetical protein